MEAESQSIRFIPIKVREHSKEQKKEISYENYETIDSIFERLGYLNPIKRKEYILSNGLKIKNRNQFIKRLNKCDKILVYDTETYKGTCKLITRNEGINPFKLNPTFYECIHFLFYKADKSSTYRFFYNIDFDFSAILKLWKSNIRVLQNRILRKISYLKNGIEVKYKEYSLKWIKSKMFIIKHISRKKSVQFTDLNSIYKKSLNEVAKIYLKNEVKDDIDGNLLNTSLDYWNENLEAIIHYSIHDCIITQKLGWILVKAIEKCELPLPKYIVSPASLSKQYFRLNSFIPSICHVPLIIQQIAYDTYFGGRFEMFKRGVFKQLYHYDIVSEYPDFIGNLPNLRDGVWKKVFKFPNDECLGFFLVNVKIPYDYKIPTIPIHHKGINKFPNGVFQKWMTWYDLDLISDYIIEVFEGYVYIPNHRNYKPFKKEIDKLFGKKQALKDKSELEYIINKLTMNALYGCFIETHKNYDINGYYELKAGIMFNSVYASQITAFGRWKVLKDIPRDKYDNIIAIHTDSITSDIPLDEFLDIGVELGQWKIEKEGKGIIFNTGMYQIGSTVKTRGIPKRFIGNWLRFCLKNRIYKKKKLEIPHMRKLSEGLIRDKSLINVNTFLTETKTVKCNSDTKRDWFAKFDSFYDVITYRIDSLPYIMYDITELHPNPLCVAHRYELK